MRLQPSYSTSLAALAIMLALILVRSAVAAPQRAGEQRPSGERGLPAGYAMTPEERALFGKYAPQAPHFKNFVDVNRRGDFAQEVLARSTRLGSSCEQAQADYIGMEGYFAARVAEASNNLAEAQAVRKRRSDDWALLESGKANLNVDKQGGISGFHPRDKRSARIQELVSERHRLVERNAIADARRSAIEDELSTLFPAGIKAEQVGPGGRVLWTHMPAYYVLYQKEVLREQLHQSDEEIRLAQATLNRARALDDAARYAITLLANRCGVARTGKSLPPPPAQERPVVDATKKRLPELPSAPLATDPAKSTRPPGGSPGAGRPAA